jgi:Phage tail assembly chaperone protein, TAC
VNERALTPFPWKQAIGFGLGVLKLSPEQFWRMTPRELAVWRWRRRSSRSRPASPTRSPAVCRNCSAGLAAAAACRPPFRMGGIKPFAAGGVIGAPTYFPLSSGGLGLAGEAGPEAIVPLSRGSDGRLGIAMSGAGTPANVTMQIVTPDVGSFRRSEAYLTGQIARAVARGQRSL